MVTFQDFPCVASWLYFSIYPNSLPSNTSYSGSFANPFLPNGGFGLSLLRILMASSTNLDICTLTVVLCLSSLCPSLDNAHPNYHDLLPSDLHYRSPHIWLVFIGYLLNKGNKNGDRRAFCCYILPALKKQRPS